MRSLEVRSPGVHRRLLLACSIGSLLLASCGTSPAPPRSSGLAPPVSPPPSTAAASAAPTATPTPALPGFVLPGQGAALPPLPAGIPFVGHLLIADNSSNSRILEIDPTGHVTWTMATTSPPLARPLGAPDDAFYTADGQAIVASSENGEGALAVARTTGALIWQIGSYGRPGRDLAHFTHPDDAVPAADGSVWMADIGNCRVLHLAGDTGATMSVLGGHGCRHNPPIQLAAPNGAFPVPDGSLVLTEISGSWVSWLNPDGTVRWSHRVPASYPSDAMAYPDGSVLLTDYVSPGSVLRIDASGRVLWRYSPRGADQLNHPSIAIPIAANRVAICDDYHGRILIVDPTTSEVVWRWSGGDGYHLIQPDGIDYRPS